MVTSFIGLLSASEVRWAVEAASLGFDTLEVDVANTRVPVQTMVINLCAANAGPGILGLPGEGPSNLETWPRSQLTDGPMIDGSKSLWWPEGHPGWRTGRELGTGRDRGRHRGKNIPRGERSGAPTQ
jgi:hypothetical protein